MKVIIPARVSTRDQIDMVFPASLKHSTTEDMVENVTPTTTVDTNTSTTSSTESNAE